MAELIKTLRAHDVSDKRVQTAHFHVSPQQVYDRDGKQPLKVVGYTVTNQVSVKMLEVSRIGAILDALVQAGSNQIQGVSFSVANPKPHWDQARREAIGDAKHRAELYANAAGLKLGKPQLIQEQSASVPRPMFAQPMRGVAAAAEVPIAPGERSISAHVTDTYSIAE